MIQYARDAVIYLRNILPVIRNDTRRLAAEPKLDLTISRWAELRDLAEELKGVTADLNKLISELSDTTLPLQFEYHNITSLNHARGHVQLNETCRVTQRKGMRDQIHDWLRGHGFSGLIQPTVNAQTLGAAFHEPYLKGEISPPDELFGITVRKYASFEKRGNGNATFFEKA